MHGAGLGVPGTACKGTASASTNALFTERTAAHEEVKLCNEWGWPFLIRAARDGSP